MGAGLIQKYFPDLTGEQLEQFAGMGEFYAYWNARINVISRKDMEHLYERHVLHALSIARVIRFKPGTRVLDVGTGGGFPGIPLAILFPEVTFHLVDSIAKKIKVVNEVVKGTGLHNVTASQARAETLKDPCDFVVSRAVTRLPVFYPWVQDKFKKRSLNDLPNGILYLKGGDLREETAALNRKVTLYPISDFFEEPFFETKYVVYIPG